jgi:hypothetical protein
MGAAQAMIGTFDLIPPHNPGQSNKKAPVAGAFSFLASCTAPVGD